MLKSLKHNEAFKLEGDEYGAYKLVDLAISFPGYGFDTNPSLSMIRLVTIKEPVCLREDYSDKVEITTTLKDKAQFMYQGTRYVVLVIDTDKHETSDNVRIMKI